MPRLIRRPVPTRDEAIQAAERIIARRERADAPDVGRLPEPADLHRLCHAVTRDRRVPQPLLADEVPDVAVILDHLTADLDRIRMLNLQTGRDRAGMSWSQLAVAVRLPGRQHAMDQLVRLTAAHHGHTKSNKSPRDHWTPASRHAQTRASSRQEDRDPEEIAVDLWIQRWQDRLRTAADMLVDHRDAIAEHLTDDDQADFLGHVGVAGTVLSRQINATLPAAISNATAVLARYDPQEFTDDPDVAETVSRCRRISAAWGDICP